MTTANGATVMVLRNSFGDNDPGIQSITFDAGYPDDTRDKFTVKATAKRSEEHTKGKRGGGGERKEAGSMYNKVGSRTGRARRKALKRGAPSTCLAL